MACVCDFVDVLEKLQTALQEHAYDLPQPEDRRSKPQTWAYLEHMRHGVPPSRKALLMDLKSIREATQAPLPRHHNHEIYKRMLAATARTREALDKVVIPSVPVKKYKKKKAYFTSKRVLLAAREAFRLNRRKRYFFFCSKP
jgi:hypothetical protein